MNELRSTYKTFEEGLEDYLAQKRSQERDCGNCQPPSEEEIQRLTSRFKRWWEMEDFKLPATDWWP